MSRKLRNTSVESDKVLRLKLADFLNRVIICFQFFPVSPYSLKYLGESWRRKFFEELVFRLILLVTQLHFYMLCLVTAEEIQEHALHYIMALGTCVSEGQRGWMAEAVGVPLSRWHFNVGRLLSVF
jgi:hypothetical protein